MIAEPVITKGRIYYNDSTNSKNIIRLKKPIRENFPQLFKSNTDLSYTLESYATYKKFLARAFIIIEKKETLPLLLFIQND